MRCSSSIACSALLLAALAGCRTQAQRLDERWPEPAVAVPLAPEPNEPWLELLAPADGAALEAVVPLVEVRGRAGLGSHGPQDVVLTLDSSGSAFAASGLDANRNGTVGVDTCDLEIGNCNWRFVDRWTTDPGDTRIEVERDAALNLVAQLDPSTTRIGLVTFGGDASLELPVGPLDALARELPAIDFGLDRGTDIVGALHLSIDALDRAPPLPGGPPQRAILLLSDGEVAIPEMDFPAQDRYLNGFLARARETHTRVFSFSVGPANDRAVRFMAAVADGTGADHVAVKTAADIAVELQLVRLSGLVDVEMRNATDGSPCRAVRVFPNGSFDGYAPLVAGDNDLVVTATLDDGRRVVARARVRYAKPAHPTAAQLADAEKLAAALRERTVATDLAIRVEAERRRRAKELTIEAEPIPPPRP